MTKLERELQKERDIRSMELFDKPESLLQIGELQKLDQYINDLNNPIWKEIKYKGKRVDYEISNSGLIRDSKSGKIINQYSNKKGYKIASIKCENYWPTIIVHRLVAIAFIPNPENKEQVNHINGKKYINWVGNLEWNTAQENIDHAVKNGLQNHLLGEDANHNKYSNEQIHKVCKLLEENKLLNTEIAKETGVDEYSISKIKCKQDWIHISKDYNIPTPNGIAIGSDAAASKYTDEDIHLVCMLLCNPKFTMKYISDQTNVGYDMVYRIKKGLNWTHISSLYPDLGINRPDTINSK